MDLKGKNRFSRHVTQDESQPASRAMLYGAGLSEADMEKPQVGIASTGFEGNPCNMHLNGLAAGVKRSVAEQGMVGLVFNTVGVSDGIANGLQGMRYSLISRDLIADSIETSVGAHYYDAVVAVVGCDKNMPGSVMAMGRLNRPSLVVYGGTIRAGSWEGNDLNIVSVFEAYGARMSGKISDRDYQGIIRHAVPGPGACGGMYTANTMASAIEALGMSLPYSSSNPAESNRKDLEIKNVGSRVSTLLHQNICPRDVMTRRAFENAITLAVALGGSTNVVLHLMAMAHSVDVELHLDDFQRISMRTPVLVDLKPGGTFLMKDLSDAGGIPAVLRMLLEKGLIEGSCLTVTGQTMEENLKDIPRLSDGQLVVKSFDNPVHRTGHIRILRGNLAPDGAVAKITGKEGEYFEGPARVYDDEYLAIKGIRKEVQAGEVIVIRYSGPKGAPGMPEMLKPTGAVMGTGLGDRVALITDGRFSGGSHGFVVGHICPEAQEGGPLALVKDGDIISIDASKNLIELNVPDSEIEVRRKEWVAPPYKAKKGIMKKYIHTVSSASTGCITDH